LSVALQAVAACHYDGQSSDRFSEKTFLAIPDGSTQTEAIAALGEPVTKWRSVRAGGETVDMWSFRDRDNGFGTWHAVLEFAADGRVVHRDLDLRDDDH
jgi:hypothetical protein